MKNFHHQELASGRWYRLKLVEQIANIGSEVERMIAFQEKDKDFAKLALYRALELVDLTVADPKNKKRLKEILRLRELLVDFFFENRYKTEKDSWYRYF